MTKYILLLCIASWISMISYDKFNNVIDVKDIVTDKYINDHGRSTAHTVIVKTENNDIIKYQLFPVEYDRCSVGDAIMLKNIDKSSLTNYKDPVMYIWFVVNIILTLILYYRFLITT